MRALLARRRFATVEAVETFVEEHYNEQLAWLAAHPRKADLPQLTRALRWACEDEVKHKEEAAQMFEKPSVLRALWGKIVMLGSATAAELARRV